MPLAHLLPDFLKTNLSGFLFSIFGLFCQPSRDGSLQLHLSENALQEIITVQSKRTIKAF